MTNKCANAVRVRALCEEASVNDFLGFLNKSVTPYHGCFLNFNINFIFVVLAVASCEEMLLSAGFKEVSIYHEMTKILNILVEEPKPISWDSSVEQVLLEEVSHFISYNLF